MNEFLTKDYRLPLSLLLAVGGLSLWLGSSLPDEEVVQRLALLLIALSLCIAAVVATNCYETSRNQRKDQDWFERQPDNVSKAYLIIDAELRIRAGNGLAKRWLNGPDLAGQSLRALWGNQSGWPALQRLIQAWQVGSGDERDKGSTNPMDEVQWQAAAIARPLNVSLRSMSGTDDAFVLSLAPAGLAQSTVKRPSWLEFYRLLMESSLSAKIVMDEHGVVVDYNPAAQAILGFSRAEMIGAPMVDRVIPQRLRQALVEPLQRFMSEEEGLALDRRMELDALHKDGYEFPVEWTVTSMVTNNGVYFGAELRDIRGWRALEHDMSKAREEAEQANRSKSKFLATMSHEIRTSLNALLGVLSLVKADEQDQHQLSLLRTTEDAGHRLMRLLTNVLDYSKIEAGEMSSDARPFSPASVVREIAALYGPTLRTGRVRLNCDTQGNDDLWVLGDLQKLTQIITNLVSNAVKFTDKGDIDIVLSCDAPGVPKPHYRLTVRDTGIGMTQVQLERIFDAFVQVDESDRRKDLGSGLGLSISKQLANLMDCELTVNSAPKRGSEFTLTLPLITATNPELDEASEYSGPEAGSSSRVLVVEDSKPNQMIVKAMLERKGYEVDVAADGMEACAAVKKSGRGDQAYGLILMDVQMPGMDGIEATRWIRNNDYNQPIIALTAKAFMEDEKACLDAGMNDFMTKPLNYQVLLARVEMWLGDSDTGDVSTPSERVREMRTLMGDSAAAQALEVFVDDVVQRHATLRRALTDNDFSRASAELHTLFGIYTGYGFDEMGHFSKALEESCDANLMPVKTSITQFEEKSAQIVEQVKQYRSVLKKL